MSGEVALNHDEIKAKCRSVIDRFGHRDALREDDIREWLNHVVHAHGEQAVWHATRAGGFGGSDIGVLVRNFQGFRADHQASAHDIVAGKLLRAVPSEETGDLRRGHENEPRHALDYYAKYGAVRDQAAYDGLSKATGLRPWMRYSPDDVVLFPVSRPNAKLEGRLFLRLLLDYKAPRSVEEDSSIAFQYSCQLHQGAMICAANDIHLDGLQLSQFDWAQWALKDDFVDYDPDLAKLILVAGDHFYGSVLRGEVPAYLVTPKFEHQDEFAKRFGAKAQVLAQVSAVAKAMEDEKDFLAAELKAELAAANGEAGSRIAGTKLKMGDLTVTCVVLVDHDKVAKALATVATPEEVASLRKAKPGKDVSWDLEGMVADLVALGKDPLKYRTDKVDAEKAFDLLLEKELDPETFMTEQVRLTASKFMKEQAAEMVKVTYPRIAFSHVAEPAQVVTETYEAEQDVREGQSMERLAQRTAMA